MRRLAVSGVRYAPECLGERGIPKLLIERYERCVDDEQQLVGCLGDQYSHVCMLDLEGNIVERVRVRTTVQQFEKYFGAWASMRVVFEAGTHSLWVYRLLERLGHEALMARHASAGADHAIAVEGR